MQRETFVRLKKIVQVNQPTFPLSLFERQERGWNNPVRTFVGRFV